MSWMDSWSRPSKSQATPAPYYLIPGSESTPYCKSCGRIIGQRKTAEANSKSSPASYCSSRCRSHKPGPLDRKIEQAFVKFLTGEEEIPASHKTSAGDYHQKAGKKGGGKKPKGDSRLVVSVEVVEEYLFGESHKEQEAAAHGHDGPDGSVDGGEGSEHGSHASEAVNSVDDDEQDTNLSRAEMEARDVDGHRVAALSVRSGTRIRPPQELSEVNGSVGGEKGRAERAEETPEALEKRLQGQKKVKEREMVRCAARRGVVFGFTVGGDGSKDGKEERRKCEAVMLGKVVEPSYAKGDWGIRWREE